MKALERDYARPADRGTLVVWGLMGAYPFGGMAWQVLHHVVALRRLGFDVWYVEDSDEYVFDPETYDLTTEAAANVRFLRAQLERVGLGDRWIFRVPDSEETHGGSLDDLRRLYERADAVLNVTGAQELRPEHEGIRCLVYVETDPVQRQIEVAQGDADRIAELSRYDHLFTYGANLGGPDCPVPVERFTWHRTRPPVIVDWWDAGGAAPERDALTTVLNWNQKGKDVVWQGERWTWRKDVAFARYLDLPRDSALPLELAVGAIPGEEWHMLGERGWRTLPSATLADPDTYRAYIRGSLGEFTATKEQYVATRSGWFSDRSVCYLAAGRPVVTEETGFSRSVPSGEGLLAFGDRAEALEAIAAVAADYPRHAAAAAALAREYFDAERLMEEMLAVAGIG